MKHKRASFLSLQNPKTTVPEAVGLWRAFHETLEEKLSRADSPVTTVAALMKATGKSFYKSS